jgi:archaeosine synthase beta-subunit
VGTSDADRRIRGLRPAKPVVDPWMAHGSLLEDERRPGGAIERAFTVFLAGSECPFTCSFCDLWRYTTDGPTPPGALPMQLEKELRSLDSPPDRIKLYNASNFFDTRAVPVDDWPRLAALCGGARVTVESHASMVGPRTLEFARQLDARLEIAIGLETIHPAAIEHLNKKLDLARFDAAARFLANHDIDLRVFVLLGAPHVAAEESVDWAVRTAKYAASRGAAVVSLIPVRGGNGELERLQAAGTFTPPTLLQLEAALDHCVAIVPSAISADLWDAARLATCTACGGARVERLSRVNLAGRIEPPVRCDTCGQ